MNPAIQRKSSWAGSVFGEWMALCCHAGSEYHENKNKALIIVSASPPPGLPPLVGGAQ
jgi:hypothetical protein